MKFLVTGLGNIGPEYYNTRHNIGFQVLDALVGGASNTAFEPARYGDKAVLKHKGRTFILVKPSTYMNLSGKAVNYWLKQEKIPVENMQVVTDDINLPFGTLRMRAKGSDGGHNGLKHIQETIGGSKYPRLRFGVGNEFMPGRQVNYVLGKWNEEEEAAMEERLKRASEAVLAFGSIGIARAMNQFNNT